MNVTMKSSTTKNNEHNPFWIMPPTTCWLHYLKQKHYFVYLFWVLPPPFSLWLVPFRCVNGLLLVGMVRLDELALWGIELIMGFLIFLGEPRGFCRRCRCEYWIIVNLLLEGKFKKFNFSSLFWFYQSGFITYNIFKNVVFKIGTL